MCLVCIVQSISKVLHCYNAIQIQRILIHTVFISCNRRLDDGVLDVAEYTDGMSAYGYDSHDCKDVFHIFAAKLKH
jgi:hypothetical protein